MVYINNICQAHMDLQEHQEIEVHYKSGATGLIKKQDQIQKLNGDLQVKRYVKKYFNDEWVCTVIIDCAEVECIVIRQKQEL